MEDPTVDDGLDKVILAAILIGSSGFLVMVLGTVYYCTRRGDAPSYDKAPPESADVPEKTPGEDKEAAESSHKTTAREELIEIFAPAGKLGIVLENNGAGPPVVHEIRSDSVLQDEMQVGDRVIALDGEDVQQMQASKVSKMISRRIENSTRKFTVVRTVGPDV